MLPQMWHRGQHSSLVLLVCVVEFIAKTAITLQLSPDARSQESRDIAIASLGNAL